MENNKLRRTSLDEMIDKDIGKVGTEERDAFEDELRLDILGQTIKKIREEKHLTQTQLGEMVGVKKASNKPKDIQFHYLYVGKTKVMKRRIYINQSLRIPTPGIAAQRCAARHENILLR